MVTAIKTLSDTEKDILASLVGSRLVRVEAALAAPPDGAWNTVRLRTDRGSVDVSCLLETLPLNDVGDEEEFGVLSVAPAGEGRLEVPGVSADVCELPLSGAVTGVEVRGDRLDLYERGELVYSRETSKAVVLLTDLGAFCLDRQVWFEEMLTISSGPGPDALVCDEWDGWEDDEEEEPGVHYEFSKTAERL